jgi:hypothetical protein
MNDIIIKHVYDEVTPVPEGDNEYKIAEIEFSRNYHHGTYRFKGTLVLFLNSKPEPANSHLVQFINFAANLGVLPKSAVPEYKYHPEEKSVLKLMYYALEHFKSQIDEIKAHSEEQYFVLQSTILWGKTVPLVYVDQNGVRKAVRYAANYTDFISQDEKERFYTTSKAHNAKLAEAAAEEKRQNEAKTKEFLQYLLSDEFGAIVRHVRDRKKLFKIIEVLDTNEVFGDSKGYFGAIVDYHLKPELR